LVLAYLLVAPLFAVRRYRRLIQRRQTDPTVLRRYYLRMILTLGIFVTLTLTAVALSTGLRVADIGLAWPHGPAVPGMSAVLALLVLLLAPVSRPARRRATPTMAPGLWPDTRAERWWALVVSFAAGIGEEVMCRGLLVTAGLSLGVPVVEVVVATSLLFAWQHLYQGRNGVFATTIIGGVFAVFYTQTGSLLFGVILHVLLDVRALIVVPLLTRARPGVSEKQPEPASE
jgi:membrane protease YdiL (CAAX protease family)